jgi:NAD(P)-dependent dehydrogenase (short-subunit alcohol dehydrogenase family)
MAYDLTEKVVLITGAAGGIGAATARELHRRGARVAVTDASGEAAERLASELDPRRACALALDVVDAAACREAVREVSRRLGGIDVVFANAGISWRAAPGTISTCDEAEFERILEVDLLGVWRTIRAALPEIRRARGQVLVAASLYAYTNGLCNAPYAASKAAIEMLARSLRAELAWTGATASVLYPGWVATPIASVAFGGHDLATRMVQRAFPALLRRPIQPDEVARAVARGLERRSARIFVPRRWAPLSWLRGLVAVLADGALERDRTLQALVQELEGRTERP